MSLHARLLLAYGYLVALVLLGAAGAALGFHALSHDIGRVLDQNFDGARASQDMLEALGRQDRAVLRSMMIQAAGREEVASAEAALLAALDRAAASAHLEEQRRALESIRAGYETYRAARDELVGAPAESPLAGYESVYLPALQSLESGVRRLLDLSYEAMAEADREVQRRATRKAAWHAGLAALALLSMGLLARALQTHVIARLDALGGVADAVARGDLGRRAASDRSDELGRVARQLNELLDAQQELRGATEGRLSRLRQLLIGLFETEVRAAAILTLAGKVVASDLGEDMTARVERAAAALVTRPEPGAEDAESLTREVATDRGPITFRLLLAGGTRPVGWLARPAAEPAR